MTSRQRHFVGGLDIKKAESYYNGKHVLFSPKRQDTCLYHRFIVPRLDVCGSNQDKACLFTRYLNPETLERGNLGDEVFLPVSQIQFEPIYQNLSCAPFFATQVKSNWKRKNWGQFINIFTL